MWHIDLVITNYDFISSVFVHPHNIGCITFDHRLISFIIQLNQPQQSRNAVTYVYDFSKGDYEGMCNYLSNCNLSDSYNSKNVNVAWLIIKQHIIFTMDAYIPKVKLRCCHHPKWFNSQIRHQIKCI